MLWTQNGAKLPLALISNIIKSDSNSAGFLANVDKCVWAPNQVITGLGIVWDEVQGVISITDTRLQKCLAHIDKALSHPNLWALS